MTAFLYTVFDQHYRHVGTVFADDTQGAELKIKARFKDAKTVHIQLHQPRHRPAGVYIKFIL